MAGGDIALSIIINAKNNAGGIFKEIADALGDLTFGMKNMGTAGTIGADAVSSGMMKLAPLAVGAGVAVAGAAAVIGVQSVKAAGDFQSALTSLVTDAGESKDALGKVSTGILQISTDTGKTTKDLTSGMYLIESAGYHGADGLAVLKTAAQGSAVANADLTKVAAVLTTTMHDYTIPVGDSVKVMNSMIATTAQGKMKMDDLNGALTKVLPTASKAGVSFTDVEGALATMSLAGDKGAAAGTHLNQMLLSLEKPSSAASKELKNVGLTTEDVAQKMKQSLPAALEMITTAVGKKFPEGSAAYIAALGTIVGGTKQMQAVLELTGTSMGDLVKNTNAISTAYKNSGKDVENFDTVSQTLNFQLARLAAAFEAVKIAIGNALLPAVTAATKGLADLMAGLAGLSKSNDNAASSTKAAAKTADDSTNIWAQLGKVWQSLQPDLKKFVDLIQNEVMKELKEVADFFKSYFIPQWNDFVKAIGPAIPGLKILAEIIGGVLLAALYGFAKSIEGCAIIIIVVIAGVVKLGEWLLDLVTIATKAGKGLVDAFQAAPQFFSDLGKKMQDGLASFWKWLQEIAASTWKKVQDVWGAIGQWFQDRWKDVQKAAQTVWDFIVSVAKKAWDNLTGTIKADIDKIVGFFKWLYDHNYYIKDLVDFMKKAFDDGIKFLQQKWNDFSKWWTQYWSDRNKDTQKATDEMKKTTDKWGQDTSKQIQSDWDGITKNLSDTWDKISKLWTDWCDKSHQVLVDFLGKVGKAFEDFGKSALKLWNDTLKSIADAISNFWQNQVAPALADLGGRWNSFWAGIAQGAMDIGEKIIKGIADGIKNGIGYLGQALKSAISTALGALGFHDIPGFAGGVQNFQGGWAVVGEKGPELMFLPSGSSVIPQGQPIPTAYSNTSNNSDQPMIIYQMLDGKTISKVVTTYQTRELRVQGAIRSL